MGDRLAAIRHPALDACRQMADIGKAELVDKGVAEAGGPVAGPATPLSSSLAFPMSAICRQASRAGWRMAARRSPIRTDPSFRFNLRGIQR